MSMIFNDMKEESYSMGCGLPMPIWKEDKPKCGFDEKESCTRECKWFDTCTRNPIWLKEGEKSERDSKRILREDMAQ